jgi:hypothetical protein
MPAGAARAEQIETCLKFNGIINEGDWRIGFLSMWIRPIRRCLSEDFPAGQ